MLPASFITITAAFYTECCAVLLSSFLSNVINPDAHTVNFQAVITSQYFARLCKFIKTYIVVVYLKVRSVILESLQNLKVAMHPKPTPCPSKLTVWIQAHQVLAPHLVRTIKEVLAEDRSFAVTAE